MKSVSYCDYENAAYDSYGCSLKKKQVWNRIAQKKKLVGMNALNN